MPNAAAKRVVHPKHAAATALLAEMRDAHHVLQSGLTELEALLARPALDAGALTSVRLKLAGIRLTRGPLITRVATLLAGTVTEAEAAMLEQLRSSHHRLLQVATAHTASWTLDAIARNWSDDRRDTRELVRKWKIKAEHEQRLVYPLVARCAGL